MINLAEKQTVPKFNTSKSDVFSIGMCMLYCATLIDPIVAYNMDKFEIDFYYLENLLRIASKHYSEGFIKIVRSAMVEKFQPNAE
jgi:hypothetical protein